MRTVIRTDEAERDVEEILTHLLGLNADAADRLAAEIDERCELLAGQPKMGRPRDDLAPGLRSVVIGRYVLFYRFTDEAVTVVRVLHGSRDIDTIMRDD